MVPSPGEILDGAEYSRAACALTLAWAVYGATGLIMPAVAVPIALLPWRYSSKAAARGWLG